MTLQLLAAGTITGILSNVTGYVITGRLFHPYQAQTPNTWRAAESYAHYLYSVGVRVLACIGIALLYGFLAASTSIFGSGAILGAALFGVSLWAVTVAPVVIEVALFVKLAPRLRSRASARLADRMRRREQRGLLR